MYGMYAAIIDGTNLTGIKSYTLDRRERNLNGDNDGLLHQTMHAAKRAAPKIDFSTVAVESLMGLLTGSLDAPMRSIATAADFIFPQKGASAPGYSGTHRGVRLAKGHIYLDGLKWSPAADGLEAGCSAFGLSADGLTDPVELITPSLAAITPVEVFTLTALELGGVDILKCSNWDLTIAHKGENNVEEVCYDLGLPFPKDMQVAGAAGPIEVSGVIEGLDQSISPTTSGTMVAEFTQYAFGGSLGTNKLTVTVNAAMIREVTRTGNRTSGRRWAFFGRHDGTNRPLTISTAD